MLAQQNEQMHLNNSLAKAHQVLTLFPKQKKNAGAFLIAFNKFKKLTFICVLCVRSFEGVRVLSQHVVSGHCFEKKSITILTKCTN